MKLAYLTLTILITVFLVLITSIALDISWVLNHISRQIVIYVLMIIETIIGFLIAKEILKSQ